MSGFIGHRKLSSEPYQNVWEVLKNLELRTRQLHESERFLDDLLESIPDGICILEKNLTIRRVNRVMKEWFAHAAPLEGKKCFECHRHCEAGLQACDSCPTYRCFQSGKAEHILIAGPEGSPVEWIELLSYPIRDAVSGEITGAVQHLRDITERKRIEDDLRLEMAQRRQAEEKLKIHVGDLKGTNQNLAELLREVETKNAELERFSYTVSHDLRSPLFTISGFLALAEADLDKGDLDQVAYALKRISGAVEKMQELIDALLALSRAGRTVDQPDDVALDALASEVVELVNGSIAESEVRISIAPDLPVLWGDRLRLREMLQNLVENAIKYMGDQPEPRIDIGARRDDDQTVCFVRDNGMGIDPRYQEEVFGLFSQLERRHRGTGVGLALVKRIVEVHGGRIWVESEGLGHGSTFCFALPTEKPC